LTEDTYKTVVDSAEITIRERSSKFLALSFHVTATEEAKGIVDALRKKYYDATHHCYAYRLGADGSVFRANDDGEPSGTAGKPILGQMISRSLTDCLVVVVRWFGGTKLGVSGLIEAYRTAAAEVLDASRTEEKTVDKIYLLRFPFESLNDIMKTLKAMQPRIIDQQFDNTCAFRVAIRQSAAAEFEERISKTESLDITDETTL